MNEQSATNKAAWEYRAYEFWIKRDGHPKEKAKEIRKNPRAFLENVENKKIANLCGSNGRKAVPLALLGAEVTVFDLSKENERYAKELAYYANTSINYMVGDVYDINLQSYGETFDILYLEGGVLHYFYDLDKLLSLLFSLLKKGGTMILSDYHPLLKCLNEDFSAKHAYFDTEIHTGDIAYKHFFPEEEQVGFPDVSLRFYTLSEILNAVITARFTIDRFEEHRGWKKENIPWEFTLITRK
ncbi:methyltransferase type 11 [Niallia circulans]|uniref:class I SAM-dependent methyltransferase n=1 Tax=Niallia circulans TaxID=1397 RepID=UPI00077C5644|nr:class I SAM-dependent methyltransferase [Niallia circulans]MDR4314789.1 class I SAM-dependent methyltransferase [Niallia circulans]MED3837896.1 class I SAM-dependent methyltransferase [Niallia circulans]MED4242957.1 class I SAM-dependent methyltransferase [Niallia circulans]MED4246936.1 class I SAM-dependent methyltransferase [Niallia circulans]QKH61847.1 class I SAM-dependent methyltransferase [Niallia circulans]